MGGKFDDLSNLNGIDWNDTTVALTALICVAVIVLVGRSIYRTHYASRVPKDFELYINTSFGRPANQKIIKASEIAEDFANRFGGKYYFSEGNAFYSAGLNFSNLVRQSVEKQERPIIVVDRYNVNLPLTLNLENFDQADETVTTGEYKGCRRLLPHLESITFEGESSAFIHSIAHARIYHVIVEPSFKGIINFYDCWIGGVVIKERRPDSLLSLSLANTWVGGLNLEQNSCTTLSLNGGGVAGLSVPAAHLQTPITRMLSIDSKVILQGNSKRVTEDAVASYRNLLFHVKSRANPFVQQILSAVVFRLEMRYDSPFLKGANICYGLFSAYNTRPGLPLIWSVGSFLCVWYFASAFDLAVLTKPCSGGWVAEMCNSELSGRVARAFTLTFNSIINPFSTFSDASLLKSKSLLFNLLLTVFGILNLLWITLSIFAVKTRFTSKGASTS